MRCKTGGWLYSMKTFSGWGVRLVRLSTLSRFRAVMKASGPPVVQAEYRSAAYSWRRERQFMAIERKVLIGEYKKPKKTRLA